MEAILGSVTLFASNFAPRDWALCQGQLLAISSNTALFSLLGVTYGGNGSTTFALPDLQGRALVGPRTGPGLSNYDLGQVGGVESTTLLVPQMAGHAHSFAATVTQDSALSTATTGNPNTAVYAPEAAGNSAYSGSSTNTMMPFNAAVTMAPTGSGIPFGNRNPFLTLNYIICLAGIFPART